MKIYSDHSITKEDVEQLKTMIVDASEFTNKKISSFITKAVIVSSLITLNILALDVYILLPLLK